MAGMDSHELGERIRDARKRAGLSQEDLGRAVGLDRTAINKIEAGARKVTALELSDIAVAIDVRMSTFFDEPVPAIVSHRSNQDLDAQDSQIDTLLAKLANEVEFVASLESQELGLDAASAILAEANLGRPASATEAESLAVEARRLMNLTPAEPVRHLSESANIIGLLAFSRDIGRDTADAGTVLLRRGGIALVNSHMKVGRRRLALAHEIGHYLIQDDYTVDWRVADHSTKSVAMEARIDRFARALLLPMVAVAEQWRDKSAQSDERSAAIALASDFQVDMATLATRLAELGLADSDAISMVRRQRTTRADIIEMGLRVPPGEMEGTTVATPFARAVLRLVRDERISRERALDLLQGTLEESDLPRPRARRPDEIWKFVS